MNTSPPVARALAALRFGPLFELPTQTKVGPFSFGGTVTAGAVTPVDLKQAASILDSQLGQIAAGNNPAIRIIITAIQVIVDEQLAGLNANAYFEYQKVLELKHEASGVVRFINLSQYMCRDYGAPSSVAAASQFGGQSNGGGPRLLSVPLIVDLEHDQTCSIQPRTAVASGANLPIAVQFWGMAFQNTLNVDGHPCLDDSGAMQVAEQGAVAAPLASPAVNPDAYRM